MTLTVNQCIARGVMPQIDEKDIPDLLQFLEEERGVSYELKLVDPRDYRGKQKVIRAKVHAILASGEAEDKPVLCSCDRWVIDGNHRWMSKVFRRSSMEAIIVRKPFDDVLPDIYAFPKTYYYDDGKFHPIQD